MNGQHKIIIYDDGFFVKRSVSDEFLWIGYDDNKALDLNADAEFFRIFLDGHDLSIVVFVVLI